jgi:hypothetical protein
VGIQRQYPLIDGTRRGPVGARLCLLLVLGALAFAVVAPVGPARAGVFSDKGHVFQDHFPGHELDTRYWTPTTAGGVEIRAANALRFDVPAEPTAPYFWGHAAMREGFDMKPDSFFVCSVNYRLPRWPMPGNGVAAAIFMNVRETGTEYGLYQITFSRESDNVTGNERYELNVWDFTDEPEQYVKKMVTDDMSGELNISRDRKGFHFSAGPTDPQRGDKVLHAKIFAKGQKIGRITWSLWVSGQTDYSKRQPSRVTFDDFYLWSQKGFDLPPQ